MVVCHCWAVNDRRILDEVAAGALSVEDVAARCGAASGCGGCRVVVEQLVAVAGRRQHLAA
ncbi:hypothetical protein BH24ACT3_BH24ACT3_17110 [soil metagenome]